MKPVAVVTISTDKTSGRPREVFYAGASVSTRSAFAIREVRVAPAASAVEVYWPYAPALASADNPAMRELAELYTGLPSTLCGSLGKAL